MMLWKNKILLMDADIPAYKIAHRNQEKVPFGDSEEYITYPEQAEQDLLDYHESLIRYLEPSEVIYCMSGDTNFRKKLYPEYKAGRGPKPELLGALLSQIKDSWKFVQKKYLEADDVIGVLASQNPNTCISATSDKDLMMVHEAWHFNLNGYGRDLLHHMINPFSKRSNPYGCPKPTPKKPLVHDDGLTEFFHEPFKVSVDEGNMLFAFQALCGDTVDCYYGIEKYGPISAFKDIYDVPVSSLDGYIGLVMDIYRERGYEEQYIKNMIDMAWINRRWNIVSGGGDDGIVQPLSGQKLNLD